MSKSMEVKLELTVRGYDNETEWDLRERVERILSEIVNESGVTTSATIRQTVYRNGDSSVLDNTAKKFQAERWTRERRRVV